MSGERRKTLGLQRVSLKTWGVRVVVKRDLTEQGECRKVKKWGRGEKTPGGQNWVVLVDKWGGARGKDLSVERKERSGGKDTTGSNASLNVESR